MEECLAAAPAPLDLTSHDPDAPCMVHFTSGSSGRPKGIVLSSYGILHRARQNIDGMRLTSADRMLAVSGPHIGSGFAFIVASLVVGTTALAASLATEGAGTLLRLCTAERASLLIAPPPVLRALLPLAGARAACAGLRILRLGAAGLPRADLAAWRATLPADCVIQHTYASTEAMIVAEWNVPADLAEDAAVVPAGRLRPGVDYALLDENDRPVAEGQVGAQVLRARHIALGEWQAGQLVEGRMHLDPVHPGVRSMRTGDLVRLGADGLLWFIGRADRQVKINGTRVEPAEIEAVLRADPAVRDAAVVPSGTGGLHAFVAAPAADPKALRSALASRLRAALPPALRPRRLSILASLPSLPGGKLDIQALRDQAQSPVACDA